MVSLDKAAIALTMAIVAIALGVAASGGAAQDAGPAVSTPPAVSTETSESEASSFGADLAAKVREDAGKVEEKMMEEPAEQTVEIEEEVIMEEEVMEEEVMEEPTGPTKHMVDIPTGTAVPGCEETNSCFTPADITINVGDTVEWSNIDSAAHTVTAGTPADVRVEIFDSSLMMLDTSWSFTFDEAGNYDYFCMVHPWMVGSVTVK